MCQQERKDVISINKPDYPEPYHTSGNTLYTKNKKGELIPLCNFLPYITAQQQIKDSDDEIVTMVTVAGIHEDGRTLCPAELSFNDFCAMHWVGNHWGADCTIFSTNNTEKDIRTAVQSTAKGVSLEENFSHFGWEIHEHNWRYCFPNLHKQRRITTSKLSGYFLPTGTPSGNSPPNVEFLKQPFFPAEILYPLLAVVFLSPLNTHLKSVNCEPKFVLYLLGKIGAKKSTIAALFLSFLANSRIPTCHYPLKIPLTVLSQICIYSRTR